MTGGTDKVLLYGYGNPGRGDDGLGPALASAVENLGVPGVAVDANYQLTVEDAADLGDYSVVVFADAAVQGPAPFCFSLIDGGSMRHLGWTSHSVTPTQVVALARDLFGSTVRAYTLGIRGYQFGELDEVLSSGAKENLAEAVAFARRALVERRFESYLRTFGPTAAGNPTGSPTWKAWP
jgi:hydrogenase maturation protease